MIATSLAILAWIGALVLVIALQVGAKRWARRMYYDDKDESDGG